ncbi:hypothetical protein BGZ63DRAFT_399843 [Mariannaea sp. PMI_226]|nr:hypothetical protein BGZ63DRAFT_399843 [Mariannaea sp. PMI_226]
MNKLLLITLAATRAYAGISPALLAEREIVKVPCNEEGQKDCGDGCIDLTWTCCPDGSGGCPSTEYCVLGSNGQYGCCPKGETCQGNGGATTDRHTNTIIVSDTSSIVGETTTTKEAEPTTAPAETTEEATSSEHATLQTQTHTNILPNTTPAGVPTPSSNGTKPGQTTTAHTTSTVINGAASYSMNMIGGLLAGVAALMI